LDPNRRKALAAWVSVASNTTLVVLKLVVGLLIGSVSVVSEAIHSGVDLVAAAIALIAVKTASRPADEEHPFGHGKAENLSGTIEAALIVLAAAWIVWEAAHKLLASRPIDALGWGVAVMALSAVANRFVSGFLFKVAKETDSVALEADGWHLRTDVWTSAGVLGGLGLQWGLGALLPAYDFNWIDPIAAIGVAILIGRAAWKLTRAAGADLMDKRLPDEEEAWIRSTVLRVHPGPSSFHKLRTRKAGGQRFIEFHLVVAAVMSVEDSHRITDEINVAIRERFPEASITIHVEPCDRNCPEQCLAACTMPARSDRDD
jgi:cation diffusion facilitator family transporter